jgi:hypothetical protein
MIWSSTSIARHTGLDVPPVPGLYAILRISRVVGFPVIQEVFYVGRSVNLRRRFKEHAIPWRERNARIRFGPVHRDRDWEFWYRAIPKEDLDKAERQLITALQPAANSIRYTGGNE